MVNAGRTALPLRGTLRLYWRQFPSFEPVEFPLLDPAGPTNVVLQPGQIVRVGISQSSRVMTNGYYRREPSAAMDVLGDGPGAMALLDGDEVADFWLGSGAAAQDLRRRTYSAGAPLWEGSELYSRSQFIRARARRVGVVRMRSSADWQIVGNPEPVPARLPLPGADRVVQINPGHVHLVGGQWKGSLAISNAVGSVRLIADDLRGHPGESIALDLRPAPQLSLVAAQTDAVSESALPLPSESPVVAHADKPPGRATGKPWRQVRSARRSRHSRRQHVDNLQCHTPARSGRRWSPGHCAQRFRQRHQRANLVRLTALDADGPSLSLPLANLPPVPGIFAAGFTAQLSLSRAPDRDVTVVFETTAIKPAVQLPYNHGPFISPVVVPAGVDRMVVSGSLLPIPLAEPVQYRIRLVVPGWPAAESFVTLNPAPPDGRIDLRWDRNFSEGSGPVTNGLSLSLHTLYPTNVLVRLTDDPTPLLSLPEAVEIPAYTTFIQVTPVIGDDDVAAGQVTGSLFANAAGFVPGGEVFTIADNDVGSIDLLELAAQWSEATVKSGATNNFLVYAYSVFPTSARFSGTVEVALDAGVQEVGFDDLRPSASTTAPVDSCAGSPAPVSKCASGSRCHPGARATASRSR